MFTIDLLKGKGIPMKRKPWGAAVGALGFVVPILIAAIMIGFYISNRIVIRVAKQEVANYDKNIETLSDSLNLQKSFEKEKNNINSCMSEALSSINKHSQWSSVLEVIAKNMPDSMILTRLEVKQTSVKKNVPNKDNPKQTTTVNAVANTLKMNVAGRPQANNDRAVKNFKDRLRLSTLLAKKLEDIKISKEPGTLDGQDVFSYEIMCTFKPKL